MPKQFERVDLLDELEQVKQDRDALVWAVVILTVGLVCFDYIHDRLIPNKTEVQLCH